MRLSKEDQAKLWTLYSSFLTTVEDDPNQALEWAKKRLAFFQDGLDRVGDEAPSASQSSTKHSYWGE